MHTHTPFAHDEMNLPLMRRVAEILMSCDPQAYRGVDLDARGSTITLKGRVVGQEAQRQALELARTTSGVRQVVDLLTVVAQRNPKPAPSTAAFARSKRRAPSILTRGLLVVAIAGTVASIGFQHWSTLDDAVAETLPAPPPRPAVVPVQGSILYEGRPASGARLVFYPLNNHDGTARRAFALAGFDGRFALTTFDHEDGAVPGSYLVTVDWVPPAPPGADPEKYADLGNVAPKRFQRLDSTPLKVRIEPSAGGVRLAPFRMNRGYDERTGL